MFYIYLGSNLILTVLGIFVQYKLTGIDEETAKGEIDEKDDDVEHHHENHSKLTSLI